ncbi:LA_2272 family surface repeat-containing protein [Flammeovirga pacifica]|uniref:Uncharacterized protein n=1 Tax=Flammeovirga pacifica TaxID=915059 RepID=A0A1S1Z306_FLAPC|nr:hypothetical protein [Flammeovirga pacifica]OHX67465.1 hypothetical protein NH26_14485 [Flammeovirga pacifica]
MKKLLIYIAVFILGLQYSIAQSDSTQTNQFKGQVSFLYPLGTNGLNTNMNNDVSFNILWGINSGVNYFELGGIANVNKGDVNGFQIAGITNVTTGENNGFIIAGITNFTHKSLDGMQIAGINNFVKEDASGAQISGISNVVNQNMNGAQIGLTNTTRNKITGAQIGLINHADSLVGTQIGLINVVSANADGTPIGLINVVKNGYYAIEVGAGETVWGNVSFKMGTKKFYTIFKGGYSQFENKNVNTFGLGFGTMHDLSKHVSLALDLSANQIIYDNNFDTNSLNILSKADLNVQFHITKNLSIFAGPSFNVYTVDQKVNGNEQAGSLQIPEHAFYDETNNQEIRTTLWIGGQAGININF